MENNAAQNCASNGFAERLARMETAIHLGTPDQVPVALSMGVYPQSEFGSSYKDLYYNQEKGLDAYKQFLLTHPLMDVQMFQIFHGKSNELAQTQVIDWPGRPGTRVSDMSSHQVIELEVMTQEEYPELLRDYTGFMLRKYIPRVFPALKPFENLNINPSSVLGAEFLSPLFSQEMGQAYQTLSQIGMSIGPEIGTNFKYIGMLSEMGWPGMICGASEAPYDILGDYFRGTMGIFEDLTDPDMYEYIDAVCEMFAQQQIAALQYLRFLDVPAKRVFFPLHKAMDGFMNDQQFERFYWKPLKKIMMALIDMDVTPYIYTEGPYETRLDYLLDVPKGKVLYHFEKVDMRNAKRKFEGTACISGNMPISLMDYGSKEDVIKTTRQLLDDCMPGGGYIFDFDGFLDNAKKENVDALFETLDKYGKY